MTRADSARPETISYMQRHGYPSMVSVEKWSGSVEDGVAFMRQFECIVIHPRCTHVAEEMRTYSYKLNRLSGDILPDLVDEANHTIALSATRSCRSAARAPRGCGSTIANNRKPCGARMKAMADTAK